ncbi:MAG: PAS domain-containing protein [Chlorobi bacterium]|nr:PAS domain-containing protein [Chlorobiota bacterium]
MSSVLRTKLQPLAIAVFSFALMIFLSFHFSKYYNGNEVKNVRNNLFDLLISKKSLLEKALNSRIYYTKGVAAYTSINPDITTRIFDELAEKLIRKDSVISTMSLAKNGIIQSIYPKVGHEAAIGLNLLAHPARKKIVEKTIETRNTFVAGPVELVEGGIGFISYTPIFTKVGVDSLRFWGVTDIVIFRDKLFNEVNFHTTDKNFSYALRGIDGTGKNGSVFWGSPEIFKKNPVIVNVLLPTGSWQLAAVPTTGWHKYINRSDLLVVILYAGSVIISILIWLLSRAVVKIKAHEKELQALFGAMDDLIIEFNEKGEYVKIAPTNDSLLYLSRDEMLGKSLHEIFDKDKADFFMNAIQECLKTKKTVVIEYELEVNKQKKWFLARITFISDSSALFVAHDNTVKRKTEEKLKETAKTLAESNATKDKLFSIIAHDLKGPFNTTLGLIELLEKEMGSLSEEEINESVKLISSALKSQYKLMENLLHWARMQTGNMKLEKSEFDLSRIVNEIIDLLSPKANVKNIEIENKILPETKISADENMLRSILRNLIINAVKFTHEGGTVSVSHEFINGKHQIKVSDNGVGINPEEIQTIFSIDAHHTAVGTKGEKGTGLGLVLVKEMVEMHGGTIRVESMVDKGSDFIFTIS